MTDLIPKLGVIEGFYGIPWSAKARLAMARWLPRIGIDCYLYAPKSDASLRKAWQKPWTVEVRQQLQELAETCHDAGLDFYVGLSPYALYEAYGAAQRNQLVEKVRAIADLGIQGLALLFDDMPGARQDLAPRQLEIIHDVAHALGPHELIVCPTYYSDDPVLDRVFGERPESYLELLAAGLGDRTGLFWTGPQVCSESVSRAHLQSVRDRCGQRIHLWDNYPVNDSKARSEHLYLAPLRGRQAEGGEVLSGHWCNAMNQAALSLPALASLPALYGRGPANVDSVFAEAGVREAIRERGAALASTRRDALSGGDREELLRMVAPGTMAATELRDWLSGVYTFDPACLTD